MRFSWIAILLCLTVAGHAHAEATVSTGTLQSTGGSRLVCRVTNVSPTKSVVITTAHVVADAAPGLDTTGGLGFNECDGLTLAPGAGCRTASTVSANPLVAHCSVIFKGSKTAVRATLWVADGSFNLVGPVLPSN